MAIRKQEIEDRLNSWIVFNEKNKELCAWLVQMENKVLQTADISIEEMIEKLQKVSGACRGFNDHSIILCPPHFAQSSQCCRSTSTEMGNSEPLWVGVMLSIEGSCLLLVRKCVYVSSSFSSHLKWVMAALVVFWRGSPGQMRRSHGSGAQSERIPNSHRERKKEASCCCHPECHSAKPQENTCR